MPLPLPKPTSSSLPPAGGRGKQSMGGASSVKKGQDASQEEATALTPDEEAMGWAVDPTTGVKYKKLFENDPHLVDAFTKGRVKSTGFDSVMRKSTPLMEEFDGDNLNKAADLFLPHLRVPPNKDELKRLRKERELRMKTQQREYEEAMREFSQDDAQELARLEAEIEKSSKKPRRRKK